MKKTLLFFAAFLISNACFAQWTTNTGNTITSTTNQIGIGTSAPATSVSLQVMGTTVLGGSNIASGAGFSTSFLANSKLLLIGWNRSSSAGETDFISNLGNGSLGGFRFYNHDNSNNETVLMNIMGSGNVQFGATAPTSSSTYKLELYGSDPLLGLSGSVNGVGQAVGLEFNQQTTTGSTRQGGAIKSIATGVYTGGFGSTYNADLAFYSTTSGANTERMRINSIGYVGIGTSNPSWPLDIASNSNGTSGFQFTNANTGSSARSRLILNNGTTSGTIIFNGSGYPTDPNSLLLFIPTGTGSMIFGTAGTESMRILSNGNLLVGKTSQTNTAYKIDVNGNIRSNSIVVNTTGADFVFAPTYKLSSLATLDRYIQKNHHLPDIASANQMQANGLNLAENQTKLLQKTEELTLYLIEKDKQVKTQQAQIDALKEQVKSQNDFLKQLMDQLKVQQQEIRSLAKN